VTSWRPIGTSINQRGYRYTDAALAAGPVSKVTVTSAGRVTLSAKGSSWLYTLNEPSQGHVAVRLQLGSGTTWCTTFPAKPSASGANDTVDKFVGAPNLPIPTSCPPVP
jgi:hypothetical protein